MARRNLNDLLSFVTVAREGSFTLAAAQLGVTQPALSAGRFPGWKNGCKSAC